MRVIFGADDSNETVEAVIDQLKERGLDIEVIDKDEWPDVSRRVAESVSDGRSDQGVLMCWTGTGTSMMANKVKGVRAALCWDPWIAEGARKWNDANVLVMSLKRTTPDAARAIVDAWLSVEAPDPAEIPNIKKIEDYESGR